MTVNISKNGHNKLAIFMPTLFGGGGQRSMLNLAQGLTERGFEVDMVLVKAEGAFLSEVPDSVRLVNLNATRTLTSIPSLIRYLRTERPKSMLSVFGFVNVIALWAWRLAGVDTKLFVNEQNTVSQEAGNASNFRTRITPRLMSRFYPWADGIVVVSKGVREDMAKLTKIPAERIKVIHNPSVVRADIIRRANEPLDHPWFGEGKPPVLVAVGRLEPQKDYPMLIEAFARVRINRDARLIILGEGREREGLEALIKARGLENDVRLEGFVSNPQAYVARSDLFVLSSRWEGLPTVLIEALCCGTPVVSTDCPSGPQEILAGGTYGPLVPVGDAEAFSQAINAALDSRSGGPPVESWQPYEISTIVDQYIELLATNQEH